MSQFKFYCVHLLLLNCNCNDLFKLFWSNDVYTTTLLKTHLRYAPINYGVISGAIFQDLLYEKNESPVIYTINWGRSTMGLKLSESFSV